MQSYLEGRIQVITQIKYKIANVLRPRRCEIGDHESITMGLQLFNF